MKWPQAASKPLDSPAIKEIMEMIRMEYDVGKNFEELNAKLDYLISKLAPVEKEKPN